MKHKVFSIYDAAAAAYLPAFFLPTEGMAIRVFKDCCQDGAHAFGKHPEDYVLYIIGEWDDQNGVLNS